MHGQNVLSRFIKNCYYEQKSFFSMLGVLCIAASVAMYFIGKNSSHLSELKGFFWIPLPLALLALFIAGRK